MKILVIDNYDSFVYNLVHYIAELNCKVNVIRNDEIDLKKIYIYDKILLSPGPGLPSEAGKMINVIADFHMKKPILGVCLGHQAIGEFFGGKLINLKKVYHGVAENINIIDKYDYLFNNIPHKIKAGRYHSWVLEKVVPDALSVTAVDDRGKIMAVKHKKFDIRGVQFHPESIMTEYGKKIMKNWVTHE